MNRLPSTARFALVALATAFVLTLGALALSDGSQPDPAQDPQAGGPFSRNASEVTFGDPARDAATTDGRIETLSDAVRSRPDDTAAAAALAGAYLQRAR